MAVTNPEVKIAAQSYIQTGLVIAVLGFVIAAAMRAGGLASDVANIAKSMSRIESTLVKNTDSINDLYLRVGEVSSRVRALEELKPGNGR